MSKQIGPLVAVIGAGACSEQEAIVAEEVGRRLAKAGVVIVTGGQSSE